MAAADQALLDQIQKLSGALRQARDETTPASSHHYNGYQYPRGRGRGRYQFNQFASTRPVPAPAKSVEIGGQLFKASTNKLTRQTDSGMSLISVEEDGRLWDPSPATLTNLWNMSSGPSNSVPTATTSQPQPQTKAYVASTRGRYPSRRSSGVRAYKPRGRRHANMSLVLNKAKNVSSRKAKLDKQCPFFSRTGMCSRGKSCRYQHDPEKVAICPRYLAGDCPSTAENCLLSHSATLNRVPPCVHFQNNGRCKNGDHCIYPHVRVGVKNSVCRDFAVLGYCDKGIDCEDAHVRECPDFAETGSCKNPKCKLPHVIRANRKQGNKGLLPVIGTSKQEIKPPKEEVAQDAKLVTKTDEDVPANPSQQPINGVDFTFEGGDEYIPLTFVETDDEEEQEGEGEDSSEEEEEEAEGPQEGEGDETGEVAKEMQVFG